LLKRNTITSSDPGSPYYEPDVRIRRGESFGDMFVAWVYGGWREDDNGLITSAGLRARNFMYLNMPDWIEMARRYNP
jgi:hypothetical protein